MTNPTNNPTPHPLSFTGDAHLVVNSKTSGAAQQYLIENAQKGGTLAGTVGQVLDVVAKSDGSAWTLRLQCKSGSSWVDRQLVLGPVATVDSTRVQFVLPSDNQDITLRVEQTTVKPPATDPFGTVHGLVQLSNGAPLAGATVTLFSQKVRGADAALGQPTVTGADGRYIIMYARPSTAINVYVQVKGTDGALTTSSVVLAATVDETIDVVVGGPLVGPSDYDVNRLTLEPVLAGEGLTLANLAQSTDRELGLLAARSGVDPSDMTLLKHSVDLSTATGVGQDVFFALGRQRVPLSLTGILAQDPETRRAALLKAVSTNQLSASVVDGALAKFNQLSVAGVLRAPSVPHETTLGGLLATAGLSPAKSTALVNAFSTSTGTTPQFWAQIRSAGTLTGPEVDKTQFALQLGVITQNHLPLVQALQGRGITNTKGLASLSQNDWLNIVRTPVSGAPIGVPPDLAAAGVDDVSYARMVFTVVEDAYPTQMVASRASSFPRSATLTQFYNLNPGYDMRTTPVTSYLRTTPAALDFITDPTERGLFLGQLKGLERLQRIAPAGGRVDTMALLMGAGIDSAFKINRIGAESFATRFGGTLGADVAERLFTRAGNTTAVAATLLARYGAAFDSTPMAVLPSRPQSVAGLPDFQSMFGSLDFCSCEDCQSIASAAAYLVDVLHWLDTRPPNDGGKTPLTVMFSDRREDIGTIELSCPNTNTPLPYIDLVNEILELQVSPTEGDAAYQTRGEAADLAAHPEHLHTPAYVVLAGADASSEGGADAVFPFNLPFNLWLDEARTYLFELGLARSGLMEAFHAGGRAATLTDGAVATEALAMSQLEADIIAASPLTPSRTTAALWGRPGDGAFVTALTSVSTFLVAAAPPLSHDGMPYVELTDLVKTDFVQQAGALGIWFTGVTCDTDEAILAGLAAAHLERAHRFVRLRRRLGWTTPDLDRAITILGAGNLTAPLLVKLWAVQRLSRDLRVGVTEMLTWWGLLETRRWEKRLVPGVPAGAPPGGSGRGFVFDGQLRTAVAERAEDQSFYDQLFQSRSVTAEPDAAFNLAASGAALADETSPLSAHIPTIAAALGVTADELGKLAERLPGAPTANLTLANLSFLYRHVSLGRALGLDAGALLSLIALTGLDPFDAAHPENAVLLAEELKAIQASGFSIAELDYLLRHVDTKPATLEPQDQTIGVLLLELRELLRKVAVDHPDPPPAAGADLLRERLTRDLGRLFSATQVTALLGLIDPPAGSSGVPDGAEALIDATLGTYLSPTEVNAAKDALARPASATYLTDRASRLAFVLGPLNVKLRRDATRATVIDKLASTLGLDAAVVAPLVETVLFHPGPGGRPDFEVFSDPSIIAYSRTEPGSDAPAVPTPADFPDQFDAFKRLQKVALVLLHFPIKKTEIDWVFRLGPARGTLDFQALPVSPPAPADVQYAAWARLRDAFALRDRVTSGQLFDLFSAADAASSASPADQAAAFEALLLELGKRTRWSSEDVEFLVGAPPRGATPAKAGVLGLAYPEDFRDERGLHRLSDVMTAVRRIGLPVATLWPWRLVPATTDEQLAQAEDIKQAVRARLGDVRWREVTRPLRERLRERQRDALASWLIANDARFPDVFALSDQLLIDVEMSACQLTSRIKQAISSAQMFVQRALLNEEPAVRLASGDVREWKWMKSFRVWEANRKVFLYPENLLEPELRDDKSPFFRELEDTLSQGDVTDDAAESAVLGYLERLDDVARLEVVGFCRHNEDATNVVHVFARTRATPHVYYHRQLVSDARWTAWEKVEVDIEGEQVVPIVHNRRLYLFWLLIEDGAVETIVDTPSGGGDNTQKPPEKYFKLRVAWSQLRNGKWAGKHVSTAQIGATVDDYNRLKTGLGRPLGGTPSDFFLRITEEAATNDVLIEPVRRALVLVVGSTQQQVGPITFTFPTFDTQEQFVRLDRFRLSGCDGTMSLEPNPGQATITIQRPADTTVQSQDFTSVLTPTSLTIPVSASTFLWTYTQDRKILGSTPTRFDVVPSRQTSGWSSEVFFYQDQKRTFFVRPLPRTQVTFAPPRWTFGDNVPPDFWLRPSDLIPPTILIKPTPPTPDPYIFDARNNLANSAVLFRDTRPALLSSTTTGGPLLDRFLAPVASDVGTVAAIGGGAPSFIKNTYAIQTQALLRDGTGGTITFGSSRPLLGPSNARRATLNAFIDQPQTQFDLGRLADVPIFRPQASAATVRFESFYHPYVCTMARELNRLGLPGLLDPAPDGPAPGLLRQSQSDPFFAATYAPVSVAQPYPKDEFDFSYGGAYSLYNWELFFHVPLMIAVALSTNRRFEDALKWFHYIFDPTASDGQPAPQRFWKVRPFFEMFADENAAAGPIQELLLLLQYTGSDPDKIAARQSLLDQIAEWRRNPFNPHALARLRPVAYQKSVVIKYLDNLIDWADDLFRQDTLESINEATQLYVLAARLLGRRPREVKVDPPSPKTFNDLRAAGLDAFSNALVEEIEGFVAGVSDAPGEGPDDVPPVLGPTLFFCVPPNDVLVANGWDRVEDRLFKIRNCMNIEGVVRQLPLFEPPIDPALLVRAAAAGLDLGSVLSDVGAALPFQRYGVLAQRALELCNDVRQLGQMLLGALERKDAEHLGTVRAQQEVRLLSANVAVRQQQIDEANRTLESLQRAREMADIRLRYYQSRQFMNTAETVQLGLLIGAGVLDIAAGVVSLVGGAVSAIPDITVGAAGFGGSPVVTTTIGGNQGSNVTRSIAEALRIGASALDRGGGLAGLVAAHQRRAEEWSFQADLAKKEGEQLDGQILAAQIRVAVAERELDNLQLQIDQSREIEELLRSKFTNEELYNWMVGQVSGLYFQSYQLAYDVAKRAERAWQFELALPDRSFVQFGYWDGLRKGLLAGDRLYLDVQRMATAYLDENRRELELTRHVSLRQLDPVALLQLRREGSCFVRVSEAWLDTDGAGHFMRRLRNVSVTIPSVTGPYVPVRATLTLASSSIRASADVAGGYARTGANDLRFRDNVVGIQSIVTSRGQEDSGLFEANLHDERYLPFEGAGAISEWRIELPTQFRQFDYETISDVILHLRFTARDGGAPLRAAAEAQLTSTLQNLVLPSQDGRPAGSREGLLALLSTSAEAADAWQRFIQPPAAQTDQTLALPLDPTMFPFAVRTPGLKIAGLDLFLSVTDVPGYAAGAPVRLQVTPPGGSAQAVDLTSSPDSFDGLPHQAVSFGASLKSTGTWTVAFLESDNAGVAPGVIIDVNGRRRLNPAVVRDLVVAVRFKV
jgi:hypothetical protein